MSKCRSHGQNIEKNMNKKYMYASQSIALWGVFNLASFFRDKGLYVWKAAAESQTAALSGFHAIYCWAVKQCVGSQGSNLTHRLYSEKKQYTSLNGILSHVHTQYYITPPQRHKLFKSLCRVSEFYNYTFLNRWLVGVRISLSSERSSQIKKRLECLWLEQRELENGVQRKTMKHRHDNTSREVATGSLLL